MFRVGTKNRVGRETRNTGIILFGLSTVKLMYRVSQKNVHLLKNAVVSLILRQCH